MADGQTIATAFVAIRPKSTSFQAEASSQIGNATKGLASQVAKTATLLIGGATVARGVSEILKIGVAYRDSLNTFQAVTDATKSQMLAVSATAKQLGNDITIPGASAADAADAMTELARAGLSVEDSMNAAKGALQLAAAGETSAKDAANLMAAALNTFALRGSEAVRVADLFSAAANNSAASVSDIAYGVESAGSATHAAGFNINELTTALGELSNAGLSGERAGTTFRSLLVSLEKPSKKAQAALDDMGVSLYNQQGKMKPLVEIIGEFQKATEHMSEAQRNANFAQIAGTYGLTALNVLVGKGTDSYLQMERANLKQGAASDLASAKMKGLGGATRGLQNTLETAAISVYQKFSPGMEQAVLSLNDFISSAANSKSFGSDLSSAASLATGAVTSFVSVLKGGVSVLQALSPEIHAVLGAVEGLGAGPILVAVGTFKAINAGAAAWAGTQARLNALVAQANAPATAAAASTQRLAAAEQEAAAAAAEMATSTSAAAASSRALSASSATSSLTSFGGVAKTATGDAEKLAPAIAGIGAAASEGGAVAEVGLLGAATAAIAPIAVVAGVAALAAGIFYLSQQSSAAERAAKAAGEATAKLAATSAAFNAAKATGAQASQNTSDAKLQREEAALGIKQAEARLAIDKKSHASNLTLQQDAINVRIANEGWRSANSAVLKSQQDENNAGTKANTVSRQHQQALGQLITALNATANAHTQVNKTIVGATKFGVIYSKGTLDTADKVKQTAASFTELSKKVAGTQPVLSKAAGFAAEFTKQTGKVPSRSETTFIFNHTKADSDYTTVIGKLTAFEKRKNDAKLGLDDSKFTVAIGKLIAEAPGEGTTLGSALSGGVVAGLAEHDVAAAFSAQIAAAVAAARKKIRAKSPSRETAENVGQPMSEGVAAGITEGAPKAVAAAENATLGVTNAFVASAKSFRAKAKAALGFDTLFNEDVRSAIQGARQQLVSLGQTLGSSLGTFLDAQNQAALDRLNNDTQTGNPAIKAITDAIAKRAHDASVKSAADAVTAAQNTVAQLTAQGGPDSFETTAADDAVAAARESLATLQATQQESRETLADALTKAQQDLAAAVNGTPGTTTTTTKGTAGNPGRGGIQAGRPFSSGVRIAGTYIAPTIGDASSTDSTTGGTAPLDALGQRSAQRAVTDAQRALDLYDAQYKRQLDAATKDVHDATVARTKLDSDYQQSVVDAQKDLTDALSAQLDLQDQDKADALQKALDAATAAQQKETDSAKSQLDTQLNDLTYALETKQITLQQFQSAVLADVQAMAPGWNDAGSQLGTAFVGGIQSTIANLLSQADLLTTGPAAVAGGTGVGADVVSPRAAQLASIASLKATLIQDRDASVAAIKQIADDTKAAQAKSSEGGTKITAAEQARINQDTRDATKAQNELAAAMRQLAAAAGYKEGLSVGYLQVNDDPNKLVSEFLKNLAANTNK